VHLLTFVSSVAVTMLIAAIDKVRAPGAFAEAIRAFHILPADLALPIAQVLPWVELLLAVYLLAGFLSRFVAAGAAVLLGSFSFALAVSLATGNTAHPCGCFGSDASVNPILALLAGGNTITWRDLVRDLILIGLSLALVVRGAGPLSVDGLLGNRQGFVRESQSAAGH
jgi:uncharacterized membrane protein YphA (DoxX/SURF4 family)